MTKKEEQYIKELGQLYMQTGEYDHVSCGGSYVPKYKPIDVLAYIKEQEYNENLNTYMKYRTAQRYTKEWTCAGGSYMSKDSAGEFVINESGKYINMLDLESKLKPEDIENRIKKLKSEKYKDYLKFSKIQMNGSDTFAYVEDANGHYVYDNNAHKFIDITEQ